MLLAAVALAAAVQVHIASTASNPSAQAALDRGLFLYYAYDRGAAGRSFSQAAALEPGLRLAYWGEALAAGPDLNTPMDEASFARGKAAIAKGAALAPTGDALQDGLVDAMALRYARNFSDFPHDNGAYRKAMVELADKTQNENAELLAAEALLEAGGMIWQNGAAGTGESRKVLAYLNDVLERDPANPMANHLCVHAYESATDRTSAEPCAKRLDAANFPPQAEHLAHMPAHYWMETGDYAKAIVSSDRAYALMQQLATMPDEADHVAQYQSHVISVGYSAAMTLGNYATATIWQQRSDVTEPYSLAALTELRFGRYREAAAAQANQWAADIIRGLASLHVGEPGPAKKVASDIARQGGADVSSRGYMTPMLLGRLAEYNGDFAKARSWLETARNNQHADFPRELVPPLPAEEALGGLFLRTRQYDRAATAFQEGLDAYPNDPRALFGLSLALERLGRGEEAARARARFDAAWTGADTSLTADDL